MKLPDKMQKDNKLTEEKISKLAQQMSYMQMENKQIIKLIEAWWKDENTCVGKPHCLSEDCDLCINCLNDLLNKFGGEWESGKIKFKKNYGRVKDL